MLKKIVMIAALLIAGIICFPTTYKTTVKGEVYVKVDDELVQLKNDDSITNEDVVIIVEENSSIIFFVNGQKIIIRKPGTYKIAELVKGL